jgi:hypothetical protein
MSKIRNTYTGEVVLSGLPPVDAIVEHAMIEDGVVTTLWDRYYKALVIRTSTGYKLGNWVTENE